LGQIGGGESPMDDELRQALEQINKRFDEVFERIHDTETNLLRAFKGWADSVDMRVKGFPHAG
jgi:hypothetical protein